DQEGPQPRRDQEVESNGRVSETVRVRYGAVDDGYVCGGGSQIADLSAQNDELMLPEIRTMAQGKYRSAAVGAAAAAALLLFQNSVLAQGRGAPAGRGGPP